MHYELKTMSDIFEVLAKRLNVGVIFSGDSEEEGAVINRTYHQRHWKSYVPVALNLVMTLEEMGFNKVRLIADDMDFLNNLRSAGIDLAWLNTGGVQGKNAISHAPSMLELSGVPYVGHSPINYALMDHKLSFKRVLRGIGVRTAEFVVWDPVEHGSARGILPTFRRELAHLGSRWVVKPVTGRASKFIYTVTQESELVEAVEEVYRHTYNAVLIETYLPGREFAVSGGPRVWYKDGVFVKPQQPRLFSYVERFFEQDEMIFTSMDQRPIGPKRAGVIARERDPAVIDRLNAICTPVIQKLGLNYLIRMDVREDENGDLRVLEVNPKPDLSKPMKGTFSLVALGLQEHGITYNDLIISLLASFIDHELRYRPVSIPGILALLDEAGIAFDRPFAVENSYE